MELANDLSAHDLERIAVLKKDYGFEVIKAGVVIKSADVPGVDMCYWRNKRGVRVSPLFPTPEAAWRDALRIHEAAVDAVAANPGVRRVEVRALPADEAAELSRLKRLATEAGYDFKHLRGAHAYIFNGCTTGGYGSLATCIRGAVRSWARRDPEAFCKAIKIFGPDEPSIHDDAPLPTFSAPSRRAPLTTEELTRLENLDGFQSMPESLQKMTIESQILLKSMVRSGLKIDTSAMGSDGNSILHITDGQITGVQYTRDEALAFKARGKSFEEVQEDQRNAKRVYGLVEGSPEEKQIRHLEAIGYEFFFSSTSGWVCKQIDRTVASGALMSVVKVAWDMAVSENGAAWQGIGQPPVGTTLWVTPHNTLWGFDMVDHYLCEVLAYHNDFVWLQLLSDTGEVVLGKYVTTRTDKVDVKVWKGNNDA